MQLNSHFKFVIDEVGLTMKQAIAHNDEETYLPMSINWEKPIIAVQSIVLVLSHYIASLHCLIALPYYMSYLTLPICSASLPSLKCKVS